MEHTAHGSVAEERTSTGLNHRKLLMWAFLGSECMFFGSLISTHLINRGRSSLSTIPFHESVDKVEDLIGLSRTSVSLILLALLISAAVWAVYAIGKSGGRAALVPLAATFGLLVLSLATQVYGFDTTFDAHECEVMGGAVLNSGAGPCELVLSENLLDIPITSVSTFVLLMSSLAVVLALGALQAGNMSAFRRWLSVTCLLGLTFLGFQVFEFNAFAAEGLTPRTNVFGTTFLILTGFHGAHVTLGVIWLASMLVASYFGKVRQATSLDMEIAALYWHFVDIVWIIIFGVVYLIGAQGVQ
jgi:heme/copper-type cytochrome/quinol oxidase subunit 3